MIKGLTPRKAVEFAVVTEEQGQFVYRKIARRFAEEPELQELFTLLAEDEARHEKQFRVLMEQVPADQDIPEDEDRGLYLRAMSMSQFFVREKGLLGRLEDIQDATDALVRAFEMEKATVQYYEAMRDVIGKTAVLETIIEAERGHMFKIMRILLADAKFRGMTAED